MPDVDDLLAALYKLPPWPPLADIAGGLGVDEDALADLIVEAEAAGLVTPWESEYMAPTIILSPLACERMGVKLAEEWVDGEQVWYAWHPADHVMPNRGTRRNGPKGEQLAAWLDSAQSPVPGPLEVMLAAERAERGEAKAARDAGPKRGATATPPRLPLPVHLLGQIQRWDGELAPERLMPGLRWLGIF